MKKKIKICFVANNANFSGAARSLWQILKYLDKNRFETIVIINKGNKGISKLTSYSKCYTFGIKNLRVKYTFKARKWISYLLEKRWFLYRLKNFNPDIIYFNTNAAVQYMRWTKELGLSAKVICHIHGQYEGLTYLLMAPEGNIPLSDEWINATKNVPDHYIACACASKKVLINSLQIPANKITVVHESIDITEIKNYNRVVTKNELGWDNKYIIGVTASFNYRKGADILIEAVKIVSEFTHRNDLLFVWIGSDGYAGGKSYTSKFALHCKEKIKEYGLEDKIHLMGHESDVYKFIKIFDAFALPTRDECLPLSILEAMVLQIPIVATSVSGIPEVLNKMNSILTEPNAESFANGLLSVLYDVENNITSKVENAGREVNNFDVQMQVKKIEGCITNLL